MGRGDFVKYAALLLLASLASAQELTNPFKSSRFVALTAATAAVTGIDAYQTSLPGREVGTPWLYGTHPSAHKVKLSLTMGAEVVGSAVLGYYMQRSHNKVIRRLWWVPQAIVLQAHARGMIHNFRVGQY